MEPFISFRAYRNGEWKGHSSKRAVRASIKVWGTYGGLRIFAYDGQGTYTEVPDYLWGEAFAEGEVQSNG